MRRDSSLNRRVTGVISKPGRLGRYKGKCGVNRQRKFLRQTRKGFRTDRGDGSRARSMQDPDTGAVPPARYFHLIRFMALSIHAESKHAADTDLPGKFQCVFPWHARLYHVAYKYSPAAKAAEQHPGEDHRGKNDEQYEFCKELANAYQSRHCHTLFAAICLFVRRVIIRGIVLE